MRNNAQNSASGESCRTRAGRGKWRGSAARLVGGYARLGSVRFPPFDHPVGGQPGIANLIEQSPVADAQRPRRLLPVPVAILQNFQNHLPLQLAHRLAGQLLQIDLPVDWNFSIEEI